MDKRELYKKTYEAKLREWKAKLGLMRAQSEKLSALAMLDVRPQLDGAQALYEAAKPRLAEIAASSDDEWDELVELVDRSWVEIKAAVDGAYAAMKSQRKV